jgi:hypothetical protein
VRRPERVRAVVEMLADQDDRPSTRLSKPEREEPLAAVLEAAHWQRSAGGTSPSTCSTCAPQPAQVGR